MNRQYHPGELIVQTRAGVRDKAQRIGGSIKANIPPVAQEFMQQQLFVITATVDANQWVWASILTGDPGFITAVDQQTIHINPTLADTHPLNHHLQEQAPIGLLFIEMVTRRRMRLNGWIEPQPNASIYVHAQEVYSNCAKYIQARHIEGNIEHKERATAVTYHNQLTPKQQSWIACSDTFFIASTHITGGADASHRGGNPGFIHSLNEHSLIWPDYAGNMMFNTLGNIAANPRAGLLFLDFTKGSILQLTGEASIIWDQDQIAAYTGAERLVSYQIKQVVETQYALTWHWQLDSYSPANP